MSMKRLTLVVLGIAALASIMSACTPTANDLLSEVKSRGTLVVSSDPAYPPQSELIADGARTEGTKCASDQQTVGELQGFDIDVAAEVAKRLGVEVCFVTPSWDIITAGGWAGRWDVSVGSMTITPDRMKLLYFSQPYYTTPAAFFVHKDNTSITSIADLSGKKIGACADCTYDYYLKKTLEIPGETIDFQVSDAVFTGYDTDSTAIDDLSLGDGLRLDAVLTAQPTGAGAIDDGKPIKQLGDPVFFEYLAAALDKSSPKDNKSLLEAVTKAIKDMHADGTLKTLSEKWFGLDLASAGADFDLSLLNQ
jgi:polar amino acid transport system substrate-binding protein